MKTLAATLRIGSMSLCIAAVACSAPADPPRETAVEATAPLIVQLRESTPDRVAGRLDDGAIALEFSLDRRGDARRAVVTSARGELLSSLLVGDVEDLSVLGGRLRVHGKVTDVEPELVGDGAAVAELEASAEYALARRLRGALRDRGVDPALLGEAVGPSHGTLAPAGKGVFNVVYSLSGGHTMDFPTWSFWYETHIEVTNDSAADIHFSFRCGGGYESHWLPPGRGWPYEVRCAAMRLYVRNEMWDRSAVMSLQVH